MTEKLSDMDLFMQTDTGYSFDRYTESGWMGAIRVLRKRDFTDEQVVVFMMSKHMRWAGDMDEKRSYGYKNGQTVAEYLDKVAPNGHYAVLV